MGFDNPTFYITVTLDVHLASTIFFSSFLPLNLKRGYILCRVFMLNLVNPYYLNMVRQNNLNRILEQHAYLIYQSVYDWYPRLKKRGALPNGEIWCLLQFIIRSLWFLETIWQNTRIVHGTRVMYDYNRLMIGLDSISLECSKNRKTMLFSMKTVLTENHV